MAELGFLKHANTLLRKMWHLILSRGRDDLRTMLGKGVLSELHLVADYFLTTLGEMFSELDFAMDGSRTTFRRMFSGLHLATDVFRTVSRKMTFSIILLLSFGAFRKLELKLKVKVVSYFQEEAITVIG